MQCSNQILNYRGRSNINRNSLVKYDYSNKYITYLNNLNTILTKRGPHFFSTKLYSVKEYDVTKFVGQTPIITQIFVNECVCSRSDSHPSSAGVLPQCSAMQCSVAPHCKKSDSRQLADEQTDDSIVSDCRRPKTRATSVETQVRYNPLSPDSAELAMTGKVCLYLRKPEGQTERIIALPGIVQSYRQLDSRGRRRTIHFVWNLHFPEPLEVLLRYLPVTRGPFLHSGLGLKS